jgi:hypothetical protein
LLSVVVGVVTLPGTPGPNPYWPKLQELTPLDEAPIKGGERGVFLPPATAKGDERHFWLMEARWRRPDLWFSLIEEWPPQEKPSFGVSVGAPVFPAGWHLAWRRGNVFVVKPDKAR